MMPRRVGGGGRERETHQILFRASKKEKEMTADHDTKKQMRLKRKKQPYFSTSESGLYMHSYPSYVSEELKAAEYHPYHMNIIVFCGL